MTLTHEEESTTARRLPCDELSERRALGSMLISREAIRRVSEIIRSVDFYRPAHQIIHEAIMRLDGRGEPVDAATVAAEIDRSGEGRRYDGPVYLLDLAGEVPTAASAGYYAKLISDQAVLRRLVEVGTRIAQIGYEGEGEVADLVEAAHQSLTGVESLETADGVELVHAAQVYQEVVDDQDAPEEEGIVEAPYSELREVVPALKAGQMVIVGARPGVGKSVMAADFARHASMKQGVGTVMYSLEMTRREMGQRVVAAEASVDFGRLRDKELTEDDWGKVAKVKGRFDEAPFWMSDDFNTTLSHIRARTRRLARTQSIGLVIVDYLQLMEGGGMPENRQQEVSKLSRGLKKLAGELGVAVVVLSQLNRGSTQRSDKRPQISDLRESGSLEQDADVVILLDREDTRDKDTPRAGEIDLLVEKNRHGASGREVVAAFQGHYSRIVDMAGTSWRN